MAVALPRQAQTTPRRRPAAAPKPRPVRGGRPRTAAKSAPTLKRKATIHRSSTSRASVGGRPFRIAAIIALVGVILSVIAYGMVLVPSEAMQTLKIRIPKDLQTN